MTQVVDLALVAGRRVYTELTVGKAIRFLTIMLAATVTITAPATGIINGGSAAALFDEIGLDDGGEVTILGDPLLFAHASESARRQPGTRTRLTSTANGVYLLEEMIVIPFEDFEGAIPRETHYRNRPGQNAKLRFFAKLSENAAARITYGGTVAVTATAFRIQQDNDNGEGELPLWVPRYTELTVNVPAANPKLIVELNPGKDYLKAITTMQTTENRGYVNDIIRSAMLHFDDRRLIGEDGLVDWQMLARKQEFRSGGNVFAAERGAIVHYKFNEYGRLSKLVAPGDGRNLRWTLDVVPSVVAGAGASSLKFGLHRLSRDVDAGVVQPTLNGIPVG